MRHLLTSLRSDQRGNVLMLTGLLLVVLVVLSGMAIDLGRQQLVRIKLQQASDAAALAGALAPAGTSASSTALRYFNLNFPATYMDVTRPTPSIAVTTGSNGAVQVSASAPVSMLFMKFLGTSTIAATGSSTVSTSTPSNSDYDVVMVVDESGSQSTSSPPYATREEAQQAALTTMANSILPTTGTVNPNVRMGFIGFSGFISNKWGLSSKNSDAMTAISKLRPIYQNFDHVALLAAINMLQGGTAGTQNSQINMPVGTVAANTAVPPARTARSPTATSDANGLSPAKYVVFLSDGGIMLEPSDVPGQASYYDLSGLVHAHCPGRTISDTECFAAFTDACNQVKNLGGTNAVHVFIINLNTPVTASELSTLTNCASTTIAGGPTYTATEKPNATKDFYFASDSAELSSLLSDITTTVKKTRITQ